MDDEGWSRQLDWATSAHSRSTLGGDGKKPNRRARTGLVALEGVRRIAPLFAIERESTLAGDSADQRRARRLERTRPVLDEQRAWVDEQRAIVPPKTPLGKALGYLHRQWRRLLLFLDDGNIEATNNRRERELRRLILGRKN
jgi:transposase